MEIIAEGKNFRLVAESELPELIKCLESFLPESLKFQQTIKTYLKDRVWDFHFYIAKEWPRQPVAMHFPGCTRTPDNNIYQSLTIFCPLSHKECIELIQTEDILINWKKPMYMHFAHKDIVDRFELFYKDFGKMEPLVCDILIYKDITTLKQWKNEPSDDAEIRPLTINDIQTVYNLYPGNQVECMDLFVALVEKLPALGIFDKETNELASWMMTSYYGAMIAMQTLPKYRRKGYGVRVAKALTKLVAERDYIPFVAILPHNAASRNLYTKLGFEFCYQMSRVKLTPHNN